ncbi:MAG: dTMP kinase [Synergistaceae bacterium]|jgi:dTMP kinase|nr:dTMP kinase [Synergistaceae bacterium]
MAANRDNGQGVFITFEGIDGCGKSTQAERLAAFLKKTPGAEGVLRTFEPGGWKGGRLLRDLLLGDTPLGLRTELLLFLADRSGHLDAEILPALRQKQWVICERYTDSTFAYQSWGRGGSFSEMESLFQWCRFPVPDLTIFLDIDLDAAFSRLTARGGTDRIESDGRAFMGRVAEGFRELAKRAPERIVTVDAGRSVEQVAENVREHVTALLETLRG